MTDTTLSAACESAVEAGEAGQEAAETVANLMREIEIDGSEKLTAIGEEAKAAGAHAEKLWTRFFDLKFGKRQHTRKSIMRCQMRGCTGNLVEEPDADVTVRGENLTRQTFRRLARERWKGWKKSRYCTVPLSEPVTLYCHLCGIGHVVRYTETPERSEREPREIEYRRGIGGGVKKNRRLPSVV